MRRHQQQRHRVLQIVAKLLIPYILLFALYVQFHGDYGPGGGFQAGVIFAVGFILHGLIFGVLRTRKVVTPGAVRNLMAVGVLLYAGTGVLSMFMGGHYLDYGVLADDPLRGQHWGIFAVELGVGITVAAVMISLFYSFASPRGEVAASNAPAESTANFGKMTPQQSTHKTAAKETAAINTQHKSPAPADDPDFDDRNPKTGSAQASTGKTKTGETKTDGKPS